MSFILAVTGHRPQNQKITATGEVIPAKLGGWATNPVHIKVMQDLKAEFEKRKPDYVITGMALGVDQMAADVCISLGIPFVAAVPFEGQEAIWPGPSKQRYNALIKKAAQVITVCTPGFEPWKMHARNKWMVDNCNELIAVWDGTPGGTAECVAYAQQIGRVWHHIYPGWAPTPAPESASSKAYVALSQVKMKTDALEHVDLRKVDF